MNKILKPTSCFVVLLLSFGIWSLLYGSIGSSEGEKKVIIEKGFTDKLSGEYVSPESLNNVQSINPFAPYLVGFQNLEYFTVSGDEKRYIEDFITVYVLQHTEKKPSIVSLVDKSFKGPFLTNEGFVSNYHFNFGINGEDIHTMKVTYNIADESIDLTIQKDGKDVSRKKFTVYSL